MGLSNPFKRKSASQVDEASQKLFNVKEAIENHMEKCKQEIKKSPTNTKMSIEFNLCQLFLSKIEK